MVKNFYKNRFYSWITAILFLNMLAAGLGAQDIRYFTIAVLSLLVFIVQDIKAYVAKQLEEHINSKQDLE